jgi:2-methylcitrate dehydratase PrpD
MTQTYAEKLAARFAAMKYAGLPAATRHGVKRLLLDYLGVAVGGSRTESGKVARAFATDQGGRAQSRLIGDDARVAMTQAAFANAISSHSLELDDIDVLALFHFSPPVYSSALAAAEYTGASGRDLVVALSAGCEMMERASRAANPSLRNRGYHTTPSAGVFGATVAAARLMKLTPARLTSALGLAGAQSAGLMEMYGPSMQKRFNPGPAARAGATSALMAKLGFTGTALIFEGERGWLKAYSDERKPSALDEGLDQPYVLDIEFKPYSCARPIHNAIDCALAIRAQPGFDPRKITAIDIERHPDWSKYHRNAVPATYHEAQVSLPFSVAVAMLEGAALLDQYSDRNLRHRDVRRLAGLARFETVDDLPRGVSVRITAAQSDGNKFTAQVDYPKGSIQNPMSDQELRAKFDSLAGPVLGARKAAALADAAMNVEKLSEAGELLKLASVRTAAARKVA